MRFFKKCRFLSVKYFVKWQIKPQGLKSVIFCIK